jgi:hypothetical protein
VLAIKRREIAPSAGEADSQGCLTDEHREEKGKGGEIGKWKWSVRRDGRFIFGQNIPNR